jgi:hypothetical protein
VREFLMASGSRARWVQRWRLRRGRQPGLSAGSFASMIIVLAVRRDWPDGTHEFIGPVSDLPAAAELRQREFAKWGRIPYRPLLSVVRINLHDFWLHAQDRPDCTAPNCPAAVDVVAA